MHIYLPRDHIDQDSKKMANQIWHKLCSISSLGMRIGCWAKPNKITGVASEAVVAVNSNTSIGMREEYTTRSSRLQTLASEEDGAGPVSYPAQDNRDPNNHIDQLNPTPIISSYDHHHQEVSMVCRLHQGNPPIEAA